MLDERTRKVIQSLTAINRKMIFTYPRMTIRKGDHVQAFIDLDKLGEGEFKEFGMYDFTDFAGSISMDKKPTIEGVDIGNNKQVLHIKDESTNGLTKYVTSDIDMLTAGGCRGNLDLPERMLDETRNTRVLEFEITRDQFDILRKKAKHFKMTDVVIKASKEDKITMGVRGVEDSTNDYIITFDGSVFEDIQLNLDIELVDILPNGSYKIVVIKSQKGTPMPIFISTTIEGLSIVVARKVV